VGDILHLPFRPETFKILLLHVIEHFPQQLQLPLLNEAYRALAPSGTLIISTPNVGTLMNADKFLPPNNPKHFHCLRIEEVEEMLQKTGFRKSTRHGYDIFIEYPTPPAKLVPHLLRRALAAKFAALEKHLIFTAVKN